MSELTGKTIGQYQLIEQKSETANTLVYKAFQPALDRFVAIKILKPGSARRPEAGQRFRQQGDLIAQFHHPRLIEVYETGEAMGLIYQAMRLAENGSLSEQLAAGPQSPFFSIQRALQLFQEIVEGLEFIHAQGYIHGNLTPSNILLDAMLQPLLSDFGLPGMYGGEISPYMAPEQVQGGIVDRRADVYALGVLLYTTLVGVAPPAGMVVSPRSYRPDVPEAMERVIFKALAQNPDQRFQSATEFLYALQTALASPPQAPQPVYAPPPSAPVTPVPAVSQTVTVGGQQKGTNWTAIILGVLVVLILCVAAMIVYELYKQNQSAAPGTPTQPVEPTQPVVQPTQAPPIIILPTQPPPVTKVLPTQELPPTQPPPELPTLPPEQPTQPVVLPTQPVVLPTQPVILPTQPGELPTQELQVQQPIAPVTQPAPQENQAAPSTGLPFCGSIGLFGAPLAVVGANRLTRKRRVR